jgi:hypothetical protein
MSMLPYGVADYVTVKLLQNDIRLATSSGRYRCAACRAWIKAQNSVVARTEVTDT